MDLGSILPPRSMEEILAERVRLTIGGRVYDLPALVIDDNQRWKEQLDLAMVGLLQAAGEQGDNVGAVLETLSADPGPFLDLLQSYDKTGVLPERDVLRTSMTETQLLISVLEVWRVANPLVDIGLAVVATTALRTNALPRLTSSLRPNGDGPLGKSGAN